MDTRSLQVFVAVALGIFTGLFGALTFTPALGPWWALAWAGGALGGGILAYLLYDPIGVLRAIPEACRKARDQLFGTWPTRHNLSIAVRSWIIQTLVFNFLFSWLPLICLASTWIDSFLDGKFTLVYFCLSCGLWGLIVVFLSCVLAFGLWKDGITKSDETMKAAYLKDCRDAKEIAWYVSPPMVLFIWIPYGLYRGLCGISLACCAVPTVVWQMYVLIHSQARLICFADAAFSVALFYFFESIPVAALAAVLGGLWGVVNYRFVSRYVCHVQPV